MGNEIKDSVGKLIELHKSLMVMRYGDTYGDVSRELKLRRIIRFCAERLDVKRVGIWAMNGDRDQIRCEALYLRDREEYQEGMLLLEKDYPVYFEAIHDDRLINADDACQDPRTREFADTYLKPHGISSMLDAPIFAGGQLVGVLCIEHVGPRRHWDLADISYAAAVADTISTINEQELWEQARLQTEFLEQYDSLTGLVNRYVFQQRIDRDVQDHPRDPHVLVLLGLDGFTALNDKYGQQQADQVLRSLGQRFQDSVSGESCLAARLGGDVFGFWLTEVRDTLQVDELLATIRWVLEEPVQTEEGTTIQVDGTMGVFSYPYEGEGMPDPVRGAEIAMRNAKKDEPGSVGYFSAKWYQQLLQKQKQAEELMQAFEARQLRAFYQPIMGGVEVQSRIGLEALVRWQHPERGILAPGHFLALVAELGLMKRLGDFMLRQACEDARNLRQKGHRLGWISVNLSAEQLYSPTLVEDVQRLLQEYELPGDCLELEIVEELIGRDSELVLAQLRGLSALGVSLSIDDFGTGYSSLSRLKDLPVSKLKVDKSFVDGLPHSEDDQCITRSIIGLAKAMRLQLVAEGVETLAQAEWLRQEAIDYLQGYLFAKPMSLNDTESFLAQTP